METVDWWCILGYAHSEQGYLGTTWLLGLGEYLGTTWLLGLGEYLGTTWVPF